MMLRNRLVAVIVWLLAVSWAVSQEAGKKSPINIEDWTPRPAADRRAEPWQKKTEKDWADPRFREMDTGPFLNATIDYPLANETARVYRGTALKLEANDKLATLLFERNTLRWAAGWSDGWLLHSDRRFGLLNIPAAKGTPIFATAPGPGWANPEGTWDNPHPATAPLPHTWAKFLGIYRQAETVTLSYAVHGVPVLETPRLSHDADGSPFLVRNVAIGPTTRLMKLLVCELPADGRWQGGKTDSSIMAPVDAGFLRVCTVLSANGVRLKLVSPKRVEIWLEPHAHRRQFQFAVGRVGKDWHQRDPYDAPPALLVSPDKLMEAAKTPFEMGFFASLQGDVGKDDGPLAVDTIPLPFKNRYKSLFFVTGLDFTPEDNVAISTAHGDVWLAKGVTDQLLRIHWRRFASGMYQPLGLKIVDGAMYVLERGQITRLHDRNRDGVADFYECFNSAWHVGDGPHSFDTSLETDPQGDFFFHKTGDTDTPTGGCLLRVARDGSKLDVFATGFRHPIGLGISPQGVITGADQEGNWMPATRVDEYRQGGFYGDMRAHHRTDPPKTYDPPICWIPREVDNSAGGQVWVPEGQWGTLGGLPLHLSYGRCKMFVLMRQRVGEVVQGGVVELPASFLSGIKTGRFKPSTGELYVVGLNGWTTAAQQDGCLQRVRYTGKTLHRPLELTAKVGALRIKFSEPLDSATTEDLKNWRIHQWNYRWTKDYGSKRYSVANPEKVGQDDVPIQSVRRISEREVELTVPTLRPVMQMQTAYHLKSAEGQPVVGSVYHTIHQLAEVPRP